MTNSNGISWILAVGLLLAVLPVTGCVATVGVANASIPSDAAQTCGGHCQSIGMQLSAVAIMAENVGCICQFAAPPRASSGTAGELGSPPAGMSTIVLQQAVAAAAAAQQRQRQQQPRRY